MTAGGTERSVLRRRSSPACLARPVPGCAGRARSHESSRLRHAAAIAWQAVKAGEPLTVLSLEPRLYAGGTSITPLKPT
ncbi:hypothetical protein GPZ77_01730 [Streptomyces sp. QHH-9511]|nr:hypothetical protein GPZ77_01730 [Streptomyces sp. QHH-9511]